MRIALAQINTTIGDFSGNLNLILDYVRRAGQRNADLVVFPELALTGYPPLDLLDRPDFIEHNIRTLHTLIGKITHPACIVGFVDRRSSPVGKPLANAAAFIHQKKVLGIKHKQLLPAYDVFDEGRYFEPGDAGTLFHFMGKKIGVSICEDIWSDPYYWGRKFYPIDPIEEQARAGAELLINISASPYSMGRGKVRHGLLGRRASRHQVPLVYVNLVGGNDDLVFDGASLVFNSDGEIAKALAVFKEDLQVLDVTRLRPATLSRPKEEEWVLDALVLGLKDYLRKCGFKRVVLGLSGGIDSSLTAWIAAQALGPKNVLGLSLPSPYSSKGSLRDAEILAKNLGIEYRVYPISTLFEEYKRVLGFSGERKVDVTLQNIQARIRGNILMALSNREGRLLLSTGNKSELSVGYCTLYGDMAGGFSVLMDVPKTLVYRLASVANRRKKSIPLSVIRKPPSAELAPGQLDSDELPPFNIMDGILTSYIEGQRSPKEILAQGYKKELVEKILHRLDANEYKRRQAPPGIRITAKAFGYGRRMPISSKYRAKF